jgi:hypothetical protein
MHLLLVISLADNFKTCWFSLKIDEDPIIQISLLLVLVGSVLLGAFPSVDVKAENAPEYPSIL